jgi:hypothetical protein
MEARAVAPTPGLWRRVFEVIQAVEMSSGECQDLRIDALERRVAELETALRSGASASSEASSTSVQETS